MIIHKIKPTSLPSILFAHEYFSENYDFRFPKEDNMFEITYSIEGDSILERNGEKIIIKEGSLHVDHRTVQEHAYSNGKQRHITVGFTMQTDEDDDLLLPNVILFPRGEHFRYLITDIVQEYALQGKTTTKLCSMIFNLMAEIDEEYRKTLQPSMTIFSEQRYVNKAKHYVVSHISEKITVENIAKSVGLSIGYLSNIFKKVTGQTMIEFVNESKLRLVKELVSKKHLTLKEASILAGYNDENYVSRLYKRYFGINITSHIQ